MADVGSRGVSTIVGYVLNLAVALLLVTALLAAAGTFVSDQRHRAARDELGVVGERFTAGLATAHRLNATGDTGGVEIDLPPTVAGRPYRVRVNTTNHTVVLTLDSHAVSVTTQYPADVDGVASGTVNSGTVRVSFGPDGLEVANA